MRGQEAVQGRKMAGDLVSRGVDRDEGPWGQDRGASLKLRMAQATSPALNSGTRDRTGGRPSEKRCRAKHLAGALLARRRRHPGIRAALA